MSLSRFASADAVFQYNPSEIYQYETFHNLSIIKCQKIASMLRIRKVKSYKKEQLIQIILHKHNEQKDMIILETENDKGSEETKEKDAGDTNMMPFENQFKNKFNCIPYCNFKKKAWFQGNSIASFLEYEIPKKAIYDHVNK